MTHTVTLQEAQAQLHQIVARVEAGDDYAIVAGDRVLALIGPAPESARVGPSTVEQLVASGILSAPAGPRRSWQAVASRPGVLARFLAERD